MWAGPDGVFSSTDDVSFGVATTDADGGYSFDGLPAGRFAVVVGRSSLPAGLDVPSFDPIGDIDGSLGGSAIVGLATGRTTTADFGFVGSGSISGVVVLDADRDGALDTGDGPLETVTVMLGWDGFDATPGTADDVRWSALTGADGRYSFAGLSEGTFVARVDASTLPSGVAASFDRDPVVDGTTTVELSFAERVVDADFGYVGTSSITGLVFRDLDVDGILDASDTGLGNIGVTATWVGADGTPGTADDVVWDAVTSGDGSYSFDGLPAGTYRIDVVEDDLPDGLIPTTSGYTTSLTVAASSDTEATAFGYGTNVPPTALDDEVSVRANSSVVIPILDDDVDLDGAIDPSSLRILDGPDHGTVVVDPVTGTVTYTPDPTYTGPDRFDYRVCEMRQGILEPLCDTAVVDITVLNRVPFVVGGDPNVPLVVTVKVGDSLRPLDLGDPDDNGATITRVDGDLPDGIRLDTDGNFTGNSTKTGRYELTITVCDDGNPQLCTTQDIVITVTANELVKTGAESLKMLQVAMLLVFAGLGLVLGGRRRRTA